MNFFLLEDMASVRYYTDQKAVIYAIDSSNEYTAPKEDEIDHIDASLIIGHLCVADGWLAHVEVKEAFRLKGIGTNLVNLAIEHLNLDSVACVQQSQAYRYGLTKDGEAFIARCVAKGIISRQHCVFSAEENPAILARGITEDPKLPSASIRYSIPSTHYDPTTHGSLTESCTLDPLILSR